MPRTRALLLDTHALLWWRSSSSLLPESTRTLIDAAAVRLLSPISLWEVAMLVKKGRVTLDRPTQQWANDLVAQGAVTLSPITPSVAVEAAELNDFHGDPADRIIFASALETRSYLVTKDRAMTEAAKRNASVSTLW